MTQKTKKDTTDKKVTLQDPIPLEAQARLMQIMNNSPALIKFAGTEWEVTALKPAVQHLIAEEAVTLQIKEDAAMGDVLKAYAVNFPSVCRVITLALLNDKKAIEVNYDTVYETIMWESNQKDWAKLLSEILKLVDVSFFFLVCNSIAMFREMTTARKTTAKEAESLLLAHRGGK